MRPVRKSTAAAAALALTLAVGGSARAATPPPPAPTNAAAQVAPSLPDTQPGRQLGWFLDAVRSLPIPVAALETHFSPDFLAQLPPDQLNAGLVQSGAATVRFVRLAAATPTSIYAELSAGSSGPHLIVTMAVDGEGRIAQLAVQVLLPSRASLGLGPLSLPAPTGPSAVGTETVVTADATRSGRRIPVQLWYPTAKNAGKRAAPARYALPATSALLAAQAAVPVEDVAAIRTNATGSPKLAKGDRPLPVVLFSPGLGVTRPLYSGLAAEVASHGYLVAVFDHPGDGEQVELPDGTVVAARPPADEEAFTRGLATRVADARAVLDLLVRLDAQPGNRLHKSVDLGRVAIAGHSFGGATAAEAMRVDGRFRAGVNLDGTLFGGVVDTGLDRPFLLVSSDDREVDESWVGFRTHAPAAMSIEVDGTGHMSFSDVPALAGFRPPQEPRVGLGIGTIDPPRGFAIQSAYVVAFLDHHVRGDSEPLLAGPSPQYPEVHFR